MHAEFSRIFILVCLLTTSWFRNELYKDSLSLWQDTFAKSPNKGRPNIELGLAYAKAGEQGKAYERLKAAKAADARLFELALDYSREKSGAGHIANPHPVVPGVERDFADQLDSARKLRVEGRLADAIAAYERLRQERPDDVIVRNDLGCLYYTARRISDAVLEFTEAIRIDPGFSSAHANLGAIYFETGYPDDAIQELQRAIALVPASPGAHARLGFVYGRLGRRADAEKELSAALSLDPQNAEAKAYRERLTIK